VSGMLLILDLAGYVGLLLWGTHMVTSGVQRGFGAELRSWLGRNLQRRWRALLVGVGITAIMQSSTATGLMATSFTASGLIPLASGLVVMLGANVGTTLVTQVLSFNLAPIAPPLILAGVLTFRWSDDDHIKNIGRIAIGLGLMLLALSGLIHALAPTEKTPALRAMIELLSGAPILLVLLAAILTWACHSSVAVVLLVVSLTATHAVDIVPGLALVLGANVGSTLAPLMEAESPRARRLPLGNCAVRLAGCLVALPFLPFCAELLKMLDPDPARMVVNFHTAFNVALAAAFILPTEWMARLLTRVLADPPQPIDPGQPVYLEWAALDSAAIALTNASREMLRMADTIKDMLVQSLDVLRKSDLRGAVEVSRMGRTVDRLGGAIRHYLADLGNEQPLDDEQEGARSQEILSAVINLEHIGSIIANILLELRTKKVDSHHFSAEEMETIAGMHAELLGSLRLALTVFLNGDPRDAARLLERKVALRRMEAQAVALHVSLLRDAAVNDRPSNAEKVCFVAEGSGLFLRIVCDLRRVHSHITTFAYPVLNRDRRISASSAMLEYGSDAGSEIGGDDKDPRRHHFMSEGR
jgi:phosphate:Na+ symporter